MSIGGSVVRVNRRFFGGNGLGRALFPGCPRDNSRMDADLTPITAALAELGDTELHALIDATDKEPQIAPFDALADLLTGEGQTQWMYQPTIDPAGSD